MDRKWKKIAKKAKNVEMKILITGETLIGSSQGFKIWAPAPNCIIILVNFCVNIGWFDKDDSTRFYLVIRSGGNYSCDNWDQSIGLLVYLE